MFLRLFVIICSSLPVGFLTSLFSHFAFLTNPFFLSSFCIIFLCFFPPLVLFVFVIICSSLAVLLFFTLLFNHFAFLSNPLIFSSFASLQSFHVFFYLSFICSHFAYLFVFFPPLVLHVFIIIFS